MSSIAGKKSALTWVVHISVLVLVLAWLFPTAGLFVSSFRTADQISSSGWWASLSKSESIVQLRTGGKNEAVQEDDIFIVEGNLLTDNDESRGEASISAFGVSSRAIGAYAVGETAEFSDGVDAVTNTRCPRRPGSSTLV